MTEFDRCAPWLEAALQEGGGLFFSLEDVRQRIIDGEATFWPGERSAVVTEWGDFPRAKVLNFWLAGGDLDELRQMHDVISAWALSEGATHTTIAGRAGWSRALGYRTAWTAMVKELA